MPTSIDHPPQVLPAERLVPILLTALQAGSDWWYHDAEGRRLTGDAFKLRARQVRVLVEQARQLGEQYVCPVNNEPTRGGDRVATRVG